MPPCISDIWRDKRGFHQSGSPTYLGEPDLGFTEFDENLLASDLSNGQMFSQCFPAFKMTEIFFLNRIFQMCTCGEFPAVATCTCSCEGFPRQKENFLATLSWDYVRGRYLTIGAFDHAGSPPMVDDVSSSPLKERQGGAPVSNQDSMRGRQHRAEAEQ